MKSHRILFFLIAVVALLALLCAVIPADGIKIGRATLRFPSFGKIMVREEQFDLDAYLAEQQRLQDSIARVIADSNDYYLALLADSNTRFWLPGDAPGFFDSLFVLMENAQAEGRTVRVLHYGDSQIEMDHITSQLRAALQHAFGGGGPGLLPLEGFTPVTAAQVWASGSYTKLSSFGDSTVSRSSGNYGPMMQCHRLSGLVSAGIKPSVRNEADSLLRLIDRVRVLFNCRGSSFSASLSVPSLGYSENRYTETVGVQDFDFKLDSCANRLKLQYNGNVDFYGLMADYGHGVAVDNIPMRGCSGHQFRGVSRELLRQAYDRMDVAMIIMQFGGNAVPYLHDESAIAQYCHEMGQQIDYVRECSPYATILFVGPSDMTATAGESWHTHKQLPLIVSCLRDTVTAHGAAYWSIYHAMGGWDSMKSWVKSGYAGKDYMHFTQKGADVMGDCLAEALMRQYDYYRFRHRH